MAKEIDYLELADILKLGQEIISDFRIRDLGLLESAVARPRTSVFGEDAYPTFPDKVAYLQSYDEELSHWIEAGSDVFLMPSRYEPCGLNQMYSQRYGTVPVVRRTGGLADTVVNWDAATQSGTGFVFDRFDAQSFYQAVERTFGAWRKTASREMRPRADDFRGGSIERADADKVAILLGCLDEGMIHGNRLFQVAAGAICFAEGPQVAGEVVVEDGHFKKAFGAFE